MATDKGNRKTLGVFSIGLMTAAAVVTSLRGLPLLAKEEMTMFAYLAFTVIFYLILASLVGRTWRRLRQQKGRHLRLGWQGIWHPLGLPRHLAAVDPERRLVSGDAHVWRGRARLHDRDARSGQERHLRRNILHRCLLAGDYRRSSGRGSLRQNFQLDVHGRYRSSRNLPPAALRLLGHIGPSHRLAASHRSCGLRRWPCAGLAGDPGIGNGRVSCGDCAAVCRRRSAGGACHRHEESEPRFSRRDRIGRGHLVAALCDRRCSDCRDPAV